MIVALIVGNVVLGAGLVAMIVAVDRLESRWVAERQHLTHIAIARHVGEIRVVESASVERTPERSFPNIEGLS